MRKIVVATFVSLDGVMQAPGGPDEDPNSGFGLGGWSFHYFDAAMGEEMDRQFSEPFDLLLGRRTYDIFAAHWPRVPDDELVARTFNACTKYVATHDAGTLDWNNSKALGADVVGALRELKAGDGPTLLVQGSSVLIQQLLAENLVDEFRVWTFPVLLGRGKRLFEGEGLPGALRLKSSNVSSTGVVMSVYEPAGEIRLGSFALEDVSDEEAARRAKFAAGDAG